MLKTDEVILSLKTVVEQETDALIKLSQTIDESWSKAVEIIRDCKGKLIISGVGKSGDIGNKIASSFTSTGTPSVFMHPTEASHGALGLLESRDVLLVLSASGKTSELVETVRYAQQEKIPIILITKNPSSPLGQLSDVVLQIPNLPEACINGLAPTTSTTCQLVVGDALVVAVMSLRNFTANDFKKFHPGGNLGTLLLPVQDFMYQGEQIPLTGLDSSIKEAIIEMNSKSLGCVGVVNKRNQYIGIFTDGDLRRALESEVSLQESVSEYMTPSPLSIAPEMIVSDLIRFLETHHIPSVFVVKEGTPVGLVHVNQLTSNVWQK
ncbi:MAG: KpsF/GutQ family sugar-phosphate isomerase [Xenococcaceae cyanobacterium MO_207.B15]|nr:KpsF/GutQ family sugar-phosphate isomerase [Xenococcaceae cyanobacterium MO_207.B15]MDJ0742632.1 KpsF/GutQ family sugar-phosphate isomerase [Xenococcaceae cyanobacterium MO_167.B27]